MLLFNWFSSWVDDDSLDQYLRYLLIVNLLIIVTYFKLSLLLLLSFAQWRFPKQNTQKFIVIKSSLHRWFIIIIIIFTQTEAHTLEWDSQCE